MRLTVLTSLLVACGGTSTTPPATPSAPTARSGTGTGTGTGTGPDAKPTSEPATCTPQQPADCVWIALHLRLGTEGYRKDLEKAAAYLRIACDADDPSGCADLADAYEYGSGVATDEVEAVRLLRRACTLGDCRWLAFHLVESDAPDERDEGLALFARICDDTRVSGDDRQTACFLRADRAASQYDGAPWHVKACEAGDARGCEKLARLYLFDEFPGTTPAQATRALEAMCERRIARACDFAAQRHFEGKGVPASRAEADRFLQKACDAGDEHACEVLARRRRLGP